MSYFADSIKKHVLDYIKSNKTQYALMLTSPWGTGKSYFINNELSVFLKDKGINCTVVSLYGLKNIQDLSKTIFIETKCKNINKKSVALESTKIIATTVVKGIASFFGINLNISEKRLQKLYESLDFSEALLILEDLERSSIDVKEVLGFVNNLVEHDGAKVLLVANEIELLKKENIKTDGGNKESTYTKMSEEYLSIKEKTIGDTIDFSNYVSANIIENVISEFESPLLKFIIKKYPNISSIIFEDIMCSNEIHCRNLRALKYSCQKTIDLFDTNYEKYNEDFLSDVFLGNVAFCLRKSEHDEVKKWSDNNFTSISLGTAKHPLYVIGYQFIAKHILIDDLMDLCYKSYKENKEMKITSKELQSALDIIYNYFETTEDSLNCVLKKIKKLIEDGYLPINEYLKLSNYLISIKENIPDYVNTVNDLKLVLLKSFSKKKTFPKSLVQLSGVKLEKEEANEEFESFEQELKKILLSNKIAFDFDYSVASLPKLNEYVFEKDGIIGDGAFLSKFDLEKFSSFLEKCDASQIASIRRIFKRVYNNSDIFIYSHSDYKSLIRLKEIVDNISKSQGGDKIVKLQLNYFVRNLEEIISLLDNGVK